MPKETNTSAAPKPRRSPAEVALEKAQKASNRAAEAKTDAQWLTLTSEIHAALGHAENRDASATLSMINMARARLLELAPELDSADDES